MSWIKLIITTDHTHALALSELLSTTLDAEAVSLVAHDDEEVFQLDLEETPLWQKTEVHALYPQGIALEPILNQINATYPSLILPITVENLPEQDWVRLTQSNFPPIAIDNKLLISPSWDDARDFPGIVLKIDPGLAFGTGTHPTTALCLEWLAQQDLQGKTVLDYGCGSGILALAAAALGAKTVYATDHDPQAVTATENNYALSESTHPDFHVSLPEALPSITADIVLANILAKPLLTLAPRLASLTKLSGQIVLSGLLLREEQTIIDHYSPYFSIEPSTEKNGWLRIVGQKKEANHEKIG